MKIFVFMGKVSRYVDTAATTDSSVMAVVACVSESRYRQYTMVSALDGTFVGQVHT